MSACGSAAGQAAQDLHEAVQRALAWHREGQLDAARALYEQVLAVDDRHVDALSWRGVLALQTNDLARAETLLRRAVTLGGEHADILYHLGLTMQGLCRLEAARDCYDRCLALQPAHVQALNNRGNVRQALGDPDGALADYDRALLIDPAYQPAHANRGNALRALQRLPEAIDSFDRAIAADALDAAAFNNRGTAFHDLRQTCAALRDFDRAVALRPGYAQAHDNRSIALCELGRFADAADSARAALACSLGAGPAASSGDSVVAARACVSLGNALLEMGEPAAARDAYARALALQPALDFAAGLLADAKLRICDWVGIRELRERIEADLDAGRKVVPPQRLLALSGCATSQRQAAQIWARSLALAPTRDTAPAPPPEPQRARTGHADRIRIGYFASTFHDHATAYLAADLFERHDRSRFECFGFSFGRSRQDATRRRVAAAFDRFFDVVDRSDAEVTQLSRRCGVDIAVDLNGWTDRQRAGIFSARAAPVQVVYLAYPGTMGAHWIDYIIADRVVIPDRSRGSFAEKVAYLPDSYLPFDPHRPVAEHTLSRAELGLPERGVVYCCFNGNLKIQPATFDGWMRILGAVEGSVLWLLEDNATAAASLRCEAAARGIDPLRLVFAKRLPSPEHLARHRAADLFLDTLPCNAHTTAADALWMGLPVLTCIGDAFAGRVAASLLQAVGMPECVASRAADHEALAIALGLDAAKLAALKAKLAAQRLTSPLFDAATYARRLEAIYEEMHCRHRAGLPPAHLGA